MGKKYSVSELESLVLKRVMVGGYRESGVDEVLDDIIEDYKEYDTKITELSNEIVILTERLKQYESMEEAMRDTLRVAQQTAEEVKKIADEKASNLIEKAEMEAHKRICDANDMVFRIKMEYETIKQQFHRFYEEIEKLKWLMAQPDGQAASE